MNARSRRSSPPPLAAWLIRWMFPDEGGSSILGDLVETYDDLAGEEGPGRARIWFWGQCARAVPAYVLDEVRWEMAMLKSYLLIALRNLRKNGVYSALNIGGLAVGIAAFVLIALYVRFELSYDRSNPDADRVYRVIREGRAFTPSPLGPALKEKIPEIAAVSRIIRTPNTTISRDASQFLENDFYWADPGIFAVFPLTFVAGDARAPLGNPSAIVLSRSAAKKYFGTADPLGQRLAVNEDAEFTVSGIFENMPVNSHFRMNAIAPYETYFRATGNDMGTWTSNFTYTYLRLREGASLEAVAGKVAPEIEAPLFRSFGQKEPFPRYFFFQPVTDIHLRSHLLQEMEGNSDIKYVVLFAAVAGLILAVACVNYMNLAVARSLRRGREVGLRKVVGARKGQLIVQYLGESVALTAAATLAAVAIVVLALPAFNNLVGRSLDFRPLQDPGLLPALVLLVLVVGVAAGFYPALRMSGFRPVSILGGTFAGTRKGSRLRNVLVLFQFATTIGIIVCALAVRGQMRFIKTADMGFSKEQIITIPIQGRSVQRNLESVRAELLRYPDIKAVATSGRLPDNIDTFTSRDWTGRTPEPPIPIYYNHVSHDFVRLYGLEVVQGRDFSRDFPSDEQGAVLVNETAVKVAGWGSPLGRTFTDWSGTTGTIVGVIKDFHSQSLHHPIAPLYLFLDPQSFETVSIKIDAADLPATLARVEKAFERGAPGTPFSFSFFDEVFDRAYAAEQRAAGIFGAFSFLAVFLACMGLFGLTAYAAEQRTREMGIRKVLGASGSRVFLLLSREFMGWVVLANLLAWPASYWIMDKWLQKFAYRIDLGLTPFVISGTAVLLVAYLTVSWQSVRAARANPVESLKYQ